MTENTFGKLPMELLAEIVSGLDREDLQNIRYMGRKINSAAKAALFETVFLYVDDRSFARLLHIGEDENTRGLVKSVIYDRRLLCPHLALETLKKKAEGSSELPINFKIWKDLLPRGDFDEDSQIQSTEARLKGFYDRFFTHMEHQEFALKKGQDEKNWLRRGLESLPNLSSLQIEDVLEDYQLSSTMVKLTTSFPDRYSNRPRISFYEDGLYSLLDMLPNIPFTLKKISLPTSFQNWVVSESNATRLSMFNSMEEFDARVIIPKEPSPKHPCILFIHEIFNSMPKLEKLSLCIRGEYSYRMGDINWPLAFDGILISHHWEHLKSVHFHGLIVPPVDFRKFLQAHSSTLRKLRLTGTTYFSSGFEDTDDSESEDGPKFPWIDLIVFLGSELSLNDLWLDGFFVTCGKETWASSNSWDILDWNTPPDPPAPSGLSLMTRIQTFVGHRGESPFKKKPEIDKNFKTWHPLSEWEYEGDSTWCFQRNHPSTYFPLDDPEYRNVVELVSE